jgi:adenylate cyclase
VAIEDLRIPDEDLLRLAVMLPIRPGREQLTLEDAAARAGMPVDRVQRLWQALGLPAPEPEAKVCSEVDIEMLRSVELAEAVFGTEVTIQLTRVLGSAMSRLADAASSVFRVNVAAPAWASDPTGSALLEAQDTVAQLLPVLARTMDIVLRHHIEAGFRPTVLGAEMGAVETDTMAVGFVDLVGSTEFSRQLPLVELSQALTAFEEAAADAVVSNGGRLVKLIGDGVMFTNRESAKATRTAIELIRACADHPVLPAARAGLAAGQVICHDGDVFGPIVNLAARAAGVARPGTLVVTSDVRDQSQSAFDYRDLGRQELKGFEGPIELYETEGPPGRR